ncbi:MAG: PilT/PilU family type 4a pilus ATPase [Gammaproteobacteria bacterium]
MNVEPLFKLMVDKDASDLFFTCFSPVKIKIDGKIMPVNKLELSPKMVKQAAMELMDEDQLEEFTRELEIDFAISKPGLGRFRINIFHQRGNMAMVLRYIKSELPDLDELNMPPILKELVMFRRGLLMMVGATGSGKSTTLAGMVNYRNMKTSSHILTIEDPIEFLHPNKRSIVNQREIGIDTKSYSNALKSAMREAPDVILIGEIRDRESMEAALHLAGTGHLVITTLHANNAPEALDRMINFFSKDRHRQIFMDLSAYLRGIISQRLVRGTDGKHVAAVEIMLNSPHVAELINAGDLPKVKEAFAKSTEQGMQNFDAALLQLYRDGKIGMEEALANADSRHNLEANIHFQ